MARSRLKHVAFEGPPGTGKSTLARALKSVGYHVIDVDDVILNLLSRYVGKGKRYRTVSDWLGFPWEREYPNRSAAYLALESIVMQAIVDYVETGVAPSFLKVCDGKPLAVALTGSSCYMPVKVMKLFAKHLLLINLMPHPETRQDFVQALFEVYRKEPRPVIWPAGFFRCGRGEQRRRALMRLYPQLMTQRLADYGRYAHADLAPEIFSKRGITGRQLMRAIAAQL